MKATGALLTLLVLSACKANEEQATIDYVTGRFG